MKDKKIDIMDYFIEVSNRDIKDNNVFMIDNKWYAPKFGCDTINMIVDKLSDRFTISSDNILLTDIEEKAYRKLTEILGSDVFLLIHKKHYKEFLVNIEEMTANIKNQLFDAIEKDFDSDHFCDCEKWCDCWEKFKKKQLDNNKNGLDRRR